jgi:carbamoyltransferase
MPFAASVILEHATEYLILQSPPECYAYMTNACETTILGREVLAAAIHPYDNTCRPQIVNQRANSEYHKLIKTFGDKSGVFGLLNTSFNVHGKPIVGSPTEALQVFTSTDLDCLILGDFFLIKNL